MALSSSRSAVRTLSQWASRARSSPPCTRDYAFREHRHHGSAYCSGAAICCSARQSSSRRERKHRASGSSGRRMDIVSKEVASSGSRLRHGGGPPRWNHTKVRSRRSDSRTGSSVGLRTSRRGNHFKASSSGVPSQGRDLEAIFGEVVAVRDLRNNNEERRRFETDESICEVLPSQIQTASTSRKSNGIVTLRTASLSWFQFPVCRHRSESQQPQIRFSKTQEIAIGCEREAVSQACLKDFVVCAFRQQARPLGARRAAPPSSQSGPGCLIQ